MSLIFLADKLYQSYEMDDLLPNKTSSSRAHQVMKNLSYECQSARYLENCWVLLKISS